MGSDCDVWAVVPVKEIASAKQRLATVLGHEARQRLALVMLEDVLDAMSTVRRLSGVIVVTLDPAAAKMAERFGADVWTDGARDGHTGAVMAAAHRLAQTRSAMITLPGDIPLVSSGDIADVIERRREAPSFTIVPARDKLGSNAIVSAPANLVPLRFGPDSFYPHLAAARGCGIEPTIVPNPRIGLDIDEPDDLIAFMEVASKTRTRRLLEEFSAGGIAAPMRAAE